VQAGIGFVAIINALEHDGFVLEDATQQEIGHPTLAGLQESYGQG
jgi:hypothetical protein